MIYNIGVVKGIIEAPFECFNRSCDMFKFILTAKSEIDLINLLVNTAKVDVQHVKWDVNSITRSHDDALLDEWKICNLVDDGKFHEVDSAIMGGDVPVGGLVVVCDENMKPSWGFVCGNGNSWYKVYLCHEIVKAILKIVHPSACYIDEDSRDELLEDYDDENDDKPTKWHKPGYDGRD